MKLVAVKMLQIPSNRSKAHLDTKLSHVRQRIQNICLYKLITFTASQGSTACNSGADVVEGNEAATESFSTLCCGTPSAALR